MSENHIQSVVAKAQFLLAQRGVATDLCVQTYEANHVTISSKPGVALEISILRPGEEPQPVLRLKDFVSSEDESPIEVLEIGTVNAQSWMSYIDGLFVGYCLTLEHSNLVTQLLRRFFAQYWAAWTQVAQAIPHEVYLLWDFLEMLNAVVGVQPVAGTTMLWQLLHTVFIHDLDDSVARLNLMKLLSLLAEQFVVLYSYDSDNSLWPVLMDLRSELVDAIAAVEAQPEAPGQQNLFAMPPACDRINQEVIVDV